MATQSALTLIDAMLEEGRRASPLPADGAVRAQAAVVRVLIDEVERHPPSQPVLAPLQAQLSDELDRLARLVGLPCDAAGRLSPS